MTSTRILEADYLVVGAGAMGMAFTDQLLTDNEGATVIIVDRYHQPGGHWTTAYPYVRLHQPSAFYGVNSKQLGSDCIDQTGWNKGLYELATNGEVCAYFDQVMQQTFLPSGRVQYFPMCDYAGGATFASRVTDTIYEAQVGKVVDATYMNVVVPSMREPDFAVAEGAACAPPNELPKLASQYERYTVVGAGKTGMDACLFLLRNDVDPARISWIMPRDSWMLDRAQIQPVSLQNAAAAPELIGEQNRASAEAETVEQLFEMVEANGQLIRLDKNITPTMYRCATVTQLELEQLRRIQDVIRLGHVAAIDVDKIVLDGGEVATTAQTLHVDCTADGLARRPAVAVFADGAITLQSVRTCQQVFSAAFTAHIEATYEDETVKNELCTPVPHPDDHIDFLRTTLAANTNASRWMQEPDLMEWLLRSRLDGFTPTVPADEPIPEPTPEAAAAMAKMAETTIAGIANLQRLIASVA